MLRKSIYKNILIPFTTNYNTLSLRQSSRFERNFSNRHNVKRLSSTKRYLQHGPAACSIYKKLEKLESSFCRECNQPFEAKGLSAKVRGRNNLCLGCSRLFGPYKNDSLMKQGIKLMLVQGPNQLQAFVSNAAANGVSSLHRLRAMFNTASMTTQSHISRLHEQLYNNKDVDEETILARRVASLQKKTKQRWFDMTNSDDGVPSEEEIYELIRRSNGKCAISNIPGVWASDFYVYWTPPLSPLSTDMTAKNTSPPPPHPFLLTFDHVIPKSIGGSSEISNVQIMLSCLNQVKGSATDEDLKLWLHNFKNSLKLSFNKTCS